MVRELNLSLIQTNEAVHKEVEHRPPLETLPEPRGIELGILRRSRAGGDAFDELLQLLSGKLQFSLRVRLQIRHFSTSLLPANKRIRISCLGPARLTTRPYTRPNYQQGDILIGKMG